MEHDKYLSIYYDFSEKFNVGCFEQGQLSVFFVFISMNEACKMITIHINSLRVVHIYTMYMCNLVNPIYKCTDPEKLYMCHTYSTLHAITTITHTHKFGMNMYNEYICIFDRIEEIE